MKVLLISVFGLIGLAVTGGLIISGVLTRTIEAELPPVGQFLSVAGQQIHYLDEGQGDVLVLLHGASTTLRDFLPSLIPPLRQHYRVVAFDRPGHGYSERRTNQWPDPAEQAAIVKQALAQLGISTSIWVGHSWSGSVVTAGLLNHPEQVIAGVLLAGASHPWSTGVAWYNDLAETPLIGPLFVHSLALPMGKPQIANAVAAVFEPNIPPPNYINETGILLALRPSAFLANAADLVRLSPFLVGQSVRYPNIHQPLLLITGRNDDIVPAWNHSQRLVRQVPNAQWVSLDSTGHALHHSRPKSVIRLIRRFADGVLGGASPAPAH